MSTIVVQCKVEKTKSDSGKFKWLTPPAGSPIQPVCIRADQVNGSKTAKITIEL